MIVFVLQIINHMLGNDLGGRLLYIALKSNITILHYVYVQSFSFWKAQQKHYMVTQGLKPMH